LKGLGFSHILSAQSAVNILPILFKISPALR